MLYLGLMSGTSLDGLDLALVDFASGRAIQRAFASVAYPQTLQQQLRALCQPGEQEIVRMGQADRALAVFFAEQIAIFLTRQAIQHKQICAIGSHGQTIRHLPDAPYPYTLQIGDCHSLATLTGIDVIGDFRRKDIALGGQGAPLVPAFHQAMFAKQQESRVIVNIGGIANITYLPNSGQGVTGFDTGPGNTLMDAWCQRHVQQAYDNNGKWAQRGKVDIALLKRLLADDYFTQPAPKSTGPEHFNLAWLEPQLTQQSPVDVQATLLALTCHSVGNSIAQLPQVDRVLVCGGGAFNAALVTQLQGLLGTTPLQSTEAVGLAPDAVEAVAFAWLAYAHQHGIAGNLPAVTGATRSAILGSYHPAN